MSNPLKWFRKYERVLLGVFGVALMFAFTFSLGVSGIDPITDYFRGSAGGGQSRDPVVVTWDDGSLRESDFEQLRVGRNLMVQFSQTAEQQARARNGQRRTQSIPPNNSDGSLLELALLSRQAEEMGIEITDDGVLDYLTQLTDGKLQPAEFSNIWHSITRGQMNDKQLLSLVRRELMAIQVRGMMQSGNYPVSPIRKWDFYNRLERRVKAEIMPLPVDQFLSKTSEPTEDDLKELYEKYKNQFAYPSSPEPGFKQRERAAFQFVKFDFDGFFEAELALVSDQEVADYYEQHQDEFREQSFLEDDLSLDDVQEQVPVPDAVDATESASDTSADGEDTADDEAADDEAADDEAADGEAADDEAADGEDTADDGESLDVEMADNMDNKEVGDSEKSENSGTDGDLGADGKHEESDSLEDDTHADEVAPDEVDSDEADSDLSELDTTGGAPSSTPSPQPPADEALEAEASIPGSDALGGEVAAETSDEGDSTGLSQEAEGVVKAEAEDFGQPGGVPAGTAGEDEPVGKFKPLAKVADEIKRNLARPLAQEKLDRALGKARSKLERYYREQVFFEIQQGKDPDATRPALPDLSDIVVPQPLKIESIPLSDELEIAKTEIGSTYNLQFTQSGGLSQTMFAEVAFGPGILLFKAQQFPTGGVAPTRFLFWKTEVQDGFVPEFDDVRQQALAAWKKQQAVDIALAAAEVKAAKVQQSGESLAMALGSEQQATILTDEITWMTGGNIPQDNSTMPRPSQIPGVDAPGYDFYRTVFSLEKGKIGFALNQPKDTVYLIQVIEQSPPQDVRQEGFLENAATIPGIVYIQLDENQRDLSSTYRDLLDNNGVEWKREPREGGRSSS